MHVNNKKIQLFVKRSHYIRTKNPLHKQSEKASCASKRDVLELATLPFINVAKLECQPIK